MAKFKLTVALDEGKKPALERFAETIGQSTATAAATLLSAALRDPASVFGATRPDPPTPVDARQDGPKSPVRVVPANDPPTPATTGVDPPTPAVAGLDGSGRVPHTLFGSSLPEEEKKKRTRRTPEQIAERQAHIEALDASFAKLVTIYEQGGGRTEGPKDRARRRWEELLKLNGWDQRDGLGRVARLCQVTPPKERAYLPALEKMLCSSNGYLTDGALAAREKRHRSETAGQLAATGQAAPGEFVHAYSETIVEKRRAADPIPRPSAGATRPALAGGLPDAPQAPAPPAPKEPRP